MSVEDWRRKIDEIDRKLVELLNERSQLRAGDRPLKKQRWHRRSTSPTASAGAGGGGASQRGPLSEAAIRRLFERILDEARSVERTVMHDERRRSPE